jgi:cell division protein FtsB
MLDLAAGIEARNYGLRTSGDPRSVLEYLKVIWPLFVIAGALAFHVWVHSQSIQVGYWSQELNAQERELSQAGQQLMLQQRTLEDPKWLEAIARRSLGMITLRPNQIIPAPPSMNWDTSKSETPGSGRLLRPFEPGKPSAFN